MSTSIPYKVEPKENVYFVIALAFSLVIYSMIVVGLIAAVDYGKSEFIAIFAFYAILILVLTHLLRGLLVGIIRGNAIKIGPDQFPDIHAVVLKQVQQLQLANVPDVYLLQQGGALNAFATRFMGTDFIVLFSDIMEEAYQRNQETVDFVIAHELGHIKRNHLRKRLAIMPAMFIPFLGYAYSRACEYTCDSIGASLSGEQGARSGLLLLAAGKQLFRKVNIHQFVLQTHTESGFWFWFAEKLSTHPHLCKRLARFPELMAPQRPAQVAQPAAVAAPIAPPAAPRSAADPGDHSKYLPQ